MFEKRYNEFFRQDEKPATNVVRVTGNAPTLGEECATALGCLGLAVIGLLVWGGIILTGHCILPHLDAPCEAVGRLVDSTIADCHPEGHECQFCDRNREDEEDK